MPLSPQPIIPSDILKAHHVDLCTTFEFPCHAHPTAMLQAAKQADTMLERYRELTEEVHADDEAKVAFSPHYRA